MYSEQILDDGCESYLVASCRSPEVIIVHLLTKTEQYEELLWEHDFRWSWHSIGTQQFVTV